MEEMIMREIRQLEAEADAHQADADAQRERDRIVNSDPRVLRLIAAARDLIDSRKHYDGEDFVQVEVVDVSALIELEEAQARFRIGYLEPCNPRPPTDLIRNAVEAIVRPSDGKIDESATTVGVAIAQAARCLPTASRFVFLDVLAGALGQHADEVREETREEDDQ